MKNKLEYTGYILLILMLVLVISDHLFSIQLEYLDGIKGIIGLIGVIALINAKRSYPRRTEHNMENNQ